MKHRMAFAAMAASVIIIAVACADRDGSERLATEPSGGKPVVSYITSSSAAIVDPRTHQLRAVTTSPNSGSGVSASVVAGVGDGDPLQVKNGNPVVQSTSGYIGTGFTDQSKHQHALIFLYSSAGGPPAVMQHYVDGALASTSAYTWQRNSTGWLRTQIVLRAVRKGALVGTYTTTTVPAKPGSGGPAEVVRLDAPRSNGVRQALVKVAYGLAFAFAPSEASAQGLFPLWPAVAACFQEWMKYAAAAATVVYIESLIDAAPFLTPALAMQFVGAAALLGAAEDMLLTCMLTHQPGPFHYDGSGSGTIGGGGGGGGGGVPQSKECLAGSYAAHCTTAFTL
ncbi:MAG: hypothetical protein M3Y30_03500 [Gemmatimonadota bacterium]|nr:hypothetical protein [Gemmatimonadota bacterium]